MTHDRAERHVEIAIVGAELSGPGMARMLRREGREDWAGVPAGAQPALA